MKKTFFLLSLLFSVMNYAKADDGIVIATYGNATGNTTRTMTFALSPETTKEYVAFQVDLTLPEGTTVDATKIIAKAPLKNSEKVTIDGTEYTKDFIIDGNLVDGKYRIIGYNLGNTAIGGTKGDIFLTIPLTTVGGVTFDASSVTASNIIFVDLNLAEVTFTDATTQSRLWGDVVKDNTVDGKDYQATANIIAGVVNTGTIDTFAADTDQSDTIDGIDYQSISNTIAGK